MIYRKYIGFLLLRVFFLLVSLSGLAWGIVSSNNMLIIGAALLTLILTYNLCRFTLRRFAAMDDFFESVKYRDFSRWFVENKGPQDMQLLSRGFNEVNRTVKEINAEKETQYVYLQKILEMVDVGIIAYNLESGKVLWANDSFKDILDFPAFKNISFVAKRRPILYEAIFETYHPEANSISITTNNEKLKVLVSETIFQVEQDAFRLILIQNIDNTLNQNESEAWKKLLSVMTHEIMNSIAPISSLADTLKQHVQDHQKDPQNNLLEIEDLYAGISSIQKRSEGLMKFAKTYRSLNKVTHLSLSSVSITELFENIYSLMQPTLEPKNMKTEFVVEPTDLEIDLDAYLVEQVLINLILNAVDATKYVDQAVIQISAKRTLEGKAIISVKDSGTGIPIEIRDSIFVPFFSTKKSGSGVGLSLCKQIMLLHKGKVQVNSEEGKGTVISLIFNG